MSAGQDWFTDMLGDRSDNVMLKNVCHICFWNCQCVSSILCCMFAIEIFQRYFLKFKCLKVKMLFLYVF